MTDILKPYLDNLKTSEPNFRCIILQDGKRVGCSNIDRYSPPIVAGDSLSTLINAAYRESFNINLSKYVIDTSQIRDNAITMVRQDLVRFIEQNLPMRSPKQSKLYRWAYRSMPRDNADFDEKAIMLYRYIHEYVYPSNIPENESKQHAQNVITLLQSLMEQYDK